MLKINKKYHIFNPQILSSSGDTIRDELGLSVTIDNLGQIILPVAADQPLKSSLLSNYQFSRPDTEPAGLSYQLAYALRLTGDEEKINSDKHWLSYIFGGGFGEQQFSGVYTAGSFLDHQHSQEVPYSIMETKLNNTINMGAPETISIKPFMKSFYQRYDSYVKGLNGAKQIPNIYEFLSQQTEKTKQEVKTELNLNLPAGNLQKNITSSDLMQNVFVCSDDTYAKIDDLNNYADLVPSSNVFEMLFDKTGELVKSINDNDFSNRFIKVLKDCFFDEEEAPNFATVPFSTLIKQIGENQQIQNISNTLNLKVVDIFEMIDYSLKEYDTENKNFNFLIDDSEEATSQYDDKSIRRLEKTIPTSKQMRFINDFVKRKDFISSFYKEPLNSNSKYNEVVAYRLEKIGGPATGDASTQKPIQNFWFMNLDSVFEFQFFDNQVVYGEEYTYNLYKYVFIAGIEYAYDGIAVSRTIADLATDGDATSSGWCLEMFDPRTSQPSAPIFVSRQISDLGNTLASEAQINSTNRYVADIALSLAPSLKIVEVPIFTKNVTILDAPTNRTGINPFYYLDNSRKIGFSSKYLPHLLSLFPTAINSQEEEYKNKFLSSYDLLNTEHITIESASQPVELQIFRMDRKPLSLKSFDDNLLNTISLKIPNQDAAFIDKTIIDKVKTNTKYYYLFRIVNELGSPAHNSQIIEAELTDDGGYRFATFNVIFENELEQTVFSNPIKKIKKIFNIVPNINNFILNDTNVDYSNTAASQINNVRFGSEDGDLVWDKKYKVRVTSKKTGKKLDINLTFKLNG
jgi:hypothetical protein